MFFCVTGLIILAVGAGVAVPIRILEKLRVIPAPIVWGRCETCGYCPKHLPTNRCSECGKPFSPGHRGVDDLPSGRDGLA